MDHQVVKDEERDSFGGVVLLLISYIDEHGLREKRL
jgi:hypothetical protein